MAKLQYLNTFLLFVLIFIMTVFMFMVKFHFQKESKDTVRVQCIPEEVLDDSPEQLLLKTPQEEMQFLLLHPESLQ